ncbi:MAG: hypothetical protein RLY86_908 [Pseudomonadota bacterium]|jgi:L-lactate dehydrogenase complex protein LldG
MTGDGGDGGIGGGTGSRAAILGTIRRAAVASGREEGAALRAVADRLATRPTGPIPARGQLPPAARVDLFIRQAQAAGAGVERLADAARIPHAVADRLAAAGLPPRIRIAPDPVVIGLDWARRPVLEVAAGPADPGDAAILVPAIAGVAETGTLMLVSGPGNGPTLAFLPVLSLILLPVERVVGGLEEAFALLRREMGAARPLPNHAASPLPNHAASPLPPRAVTLVTGPSRTADIEQTPQLHAHGPGALHILLVDQGVGAYFKRP